MDSHVDIGTIERGSTEGDDQAVSGQLSRTNLKQGDARQKQSSMSHPESEGVYHIRSPRTIALWCALDIDLGFKEVGVGGKVTQGKTNKLTNCGTGFA